MGFPTYSAARLEQACHTAEIALVHAALHPHPSVLLEVLAAVADVHYLGHFDQRNLRHVQRQQWRRPCVSVCSTSAPARSNSRLESILASNRTDH